MTRSLLTDYSKSKAEIRNPAAKTIFSASASLLESTLDGLPYDSTKEQEENGDYRRRARRATVGDRSQQVQAGCYSASMPDLSCSDHDNHLNRNIMDNDQEQLQQQHQEQQPASRLAPRIPATLDDSSPSLGDIFATSDDEDDCYSENEEYSEVDDSAKRYNASKNNVSNSSFSYNNNNESNNNNNASENSLTPAELNDLFNQSESSMGNSKAATSKRRIHRRRMRPKTNEPPDGNNSSRSSLQKRDSYMSRSMPDMGLDLDEAQGGGGGVRRRAGSGETNTNTNHKSLTDFFRKEQRVRSKTSLLPGSTTEDLCSEMNQMARSVVGGGGGRSVLSGSTSARRTPNRSFTDPNSGGRVRRRSTMDISLPTTGGAGVGVGVGGQGEGSSSKLRDYSRRSTMDISLPTTVGAGVGVGGQGEGSLSKLRDYSQANSGAASPLGGSNQQSPTGRRSVSPRRTPNRSRSADGPMFPRNVARRSTMATTSALSGAGVNIGHNSFSVYESPRRQEGRHAPSTPTQRDASRSRRLPPKTMSADGSRLTTTPRRTHTDPSRASFVTGSRIRRITPGGAGRDRSMTRERDDNSRRERSRTRDTSITRGERSLSPLKT